MKYILMYTYDSIECISSDGFYKWIGEFKYMKWILIKCALKNKMDVIPNLDEPPFIR